MFAQLRGSFDEGMDALGEQTRLVQSMQLQGEAAVLSEVRACVRAREGPMHIIYREREGWIEFPLPKIDSRKAYSHCGEIGLKSLAPIKVSGKLLRHYRHPQSHSIDDVVVT